MSTQPGSLLFLTEGSAAVGTGHLRRCATLARHLSGRGWQIHLQVLGERKLGLSEEALDSILGDLFWAQTAEPFPCAADAVIVDVTPAWQKRAVSACREWNFACAALDYQQADLLPDAIVTLKDLSGRMQAAFLQAGRPQDYHEGVAYAMMRPGISAQRGRLPAPGQNGVLDVLISLGGADPGGLTLEAMDLLRPWRNRLNHVTVVLGPGVGADLAEQARREAAQLDFQVVKAPPDFDARLGASDLVLCNGGGTLLEALCLGRLVAVLPQTEAETAFASAFCAERACVWARELVQIIETTEQERLEFAQRAASIVDGNGLERLTQVITDLATRTP